MIHSDIQQILSILIAVFIALTVHEYAHAKVADMSGDPTPRFFGRVTLNPLAHLDPLGTLMIVLTALTGFGIGWGKPVPMDPRKMHHPRWDHFWAVAAGPISNFVQAAIYAMILRGILLYQIDTPFLMMIAEYGIIVNLSICFFNLIPLGPLDGHHLVRAFLPERLGYQWSVWNARTGSLLLLMIILMGQLNPSFSIIGMILKPFVLGAFRFLMGF